MLKKKRLLYFQDNNVLLDEYFGGTSVNTNRWDVTDTTPEKLSNTGFETAGGGGADVFANWDETAGDGSILQLGSFQRSGSYCCEVDAGASANTKVAQTITGLLAGRIYEFTIYTRGSTALDTAGRYGIYDVSNSANIVAVTTTGVTGTTYTAVTGSFTTPAGCTSVRLDLWCPTVDGDVALYDDISIKPRAAISVANNILSFAGGKETATTGDPMIVWRTIVPRIPGLKIDMKTRAATTNAAGPYLVLSNTASYATPASEREHSIVFASTGNIVRDRLGTPTLLDNYSANTWYWFRIVLRSTGVDYYYSTDGVTWTATGSDATGTTNPLYLVAHTFSQTGDVTRLKVWK